VEVTAKKEPDTVSRLAVNEYRAQLSTTDGAVLLAHAGSTAEILHPTNRKHFMTLTRHADNGSVKAGLRATAFVESRLQTRPVSDSFLGAMPSSTFGDPCDPQCPPMNRKDFLRQKAALLGRARQHAAALSKKHAKVPHRPSRTLLWSPRPCPDLPSRQAPARAL